MCIHMYLCVCVYMYFCVCTCVCRRVCMCWGCSGGVRDKVQPEAVFSQFIPHPLNPKPTPLKQAQVTDRQTHNHRPT